MVPVWFLSPGALRGRAAWGACRRTEDAVAAVACLGPRVQASSRVCVCADAPRGAEALAAGVRRPLPAARAPAQGRDSASVRPAYGARQALQKHSPGTVPGLLRTPTPHPHTRPSEARPRGATWRDTLRHPGLLGAPRTHWLLACLAASHLPHGSVHPHPVRPSFRAGSSPAAPGRSVAGASATRVLCPRAQCRRGLRRRRCGARSAGDRRPLASCPPTALPPPACPPPARPSQLLLERSEGGRVWGDGLSPGPHRRLLACRRSRRPRRLPRLASCPAVAVLKFLLL